ncbi:MAG: aspartate carbamoyltransferase [Candidatus Levybacteria bacterium]|nr:aspartate carbamoyltransferase [Candidatus Levybacteria bacterium]
MAISVKAPQINPDQTGINGNFKGQDILSLSQFDQRSLGILFQHADEMAKLRKKGTILDLLKGNIVTLLFYEPSSRTFGSFSSSTLRLGGQTIPIHDAKTSSSVAKGETLEDTMGVFQTYSDLIVLRHSETGAAANAANAANVPLINAGDGIGEHPTQALMDLYTINNRFGTLDNLTVVFAGDMLNGRTVHSVLLGLSLFKNTTVYLLSPKILRLSRQHFNLYKERGVKMVEIEKETDLPKDAHVWYWTRVQKERFTDLNEYERTKNSFILTKKLVDTYGSDQLILMHPLPRVGEILTEVDSDSRAIYFRDEIENGVYVRMALLALILGKL